FGLEPRVAERLLYDMVRDTRAQGRPDGLPAGGNCVLDVVLRARPTGVARKGDTVTGVTLALGTRARPLDAVTTKQVACAVLVDATEYGDVLPLAKAAYRVGSRIVNGENGAVGSALPGETPAVQPITWTAVIRQYPSGQYPSGPPGALRVTLPPPGYRPDALVGVLQPASDSFSSRHPWGWARFVRYRGQPDTGWPRNVRNEGHDLVSRTHVNFAGNDEHFDVSGVEDRAKREEMERDARLRTLRVLHYIQSASGSPRADWAVADDEGYRTPYNVARNARLVKEHPELAPYRAVLDRMPVMAYVRESRRIVGVYTMKARDIRRKAPHVPVRFPSAVALGDYPVDVHGAGEQLKGLEFDLDLAEDLPPKWIYWGIGPFGVPMESFIPYKLDGLLAAEKNLSQSRVVSGATRLQPSTMLTGQAAGALAALSVRLGKPSRAVPPIRVQEALLAAGSTLALDEFEDVPAATGLWADVQLASVYGLLPPAWKKKALKPDADLAAGEADAVAALVAQATGVPATADAFRAALPPSAPLPPGRGDTVSAGPTRADAVRAATRALRAALRDRAPALRSDPFPPVIAAERERA
ncbi:MAG TPA: FAD-dependent oxidoreductase, partial [Armatimonadaceae bacterium]|nr:FAD-dependent oxidoreductase [Armatimonadaceae bacterium]